MPHGAHTSHSEGRAAAPAATPKPVQPAITMSPKVPAIATLLNPMPDPQPDPHAASRDPGTHATKSQPQSVDPAPHAQGSGDTTSQTEVSEGHSPQDPHTKHGAGGGSSSPSPNLPQADPSPTHSGDAQSPNTADPKIDPNSGNNPSQQPEPSTKPEQQPASAGRPSPEQPTPAVAPLDPNAKTSIIHQTYHLGSPTTGGQSLTLQSGNIVYHGSTIKPSSGHDGLPEIGTTTTPAPLASIIFQPFAGPHDGSSTPASSDGIRVINGATLTPGSPGVSVAGVTMSLDKSDNLIVASQTRPLLTAANPGQPPITIVAGQTITPLSHAIAVAGTTLRDGQALTISGTEISLDSSALIVNSKTIPLPNDPAKASLAMPVVAGQTITPLPHAIGIAGTTLRPGNSALTVSGTRISLGISSLVVGSETIPFPTVTAQTSGTPTIIAGQTITPLSSAIVLAGTTLKPNDPAMTISGTVVSLNPSALIVNSKTLPFSPKSAESISTVIAGQTLTAMPGEILIDGTTLFPGGAALTNSGITVSIDSEGAVVVGTSIASATQIQAIITDTNAAPTLTESISTVIAGETLTAIPGEILIDSTTLVPGGAALTISRTMVSVNSLGEVIVGTSTASASNIQAIITEKAANSTSVSSSSQSASGTTSVKSVQGMGHKFEISIVNLGVALLGTFLKYMV